jgi:tRNA pseudouridine65 synthase
MQACRAAPLEILYRDEHLVAIAKPGGLLVHRTRLDRHATDFAVQRLRDQLERQVLPVHRLDKATAGVLLFALTAEVAARLGDAFAAGAVDKRYLAVVRGWPAPRATIDHPLTRVADDYAPPAAEVRARPAVTHLRRLATAELDVPTDRYPTSRFALLELEPQSGRRHQLRRHLKHAGYPIVGDTTYGQGRCNRLFRERFGCGRLLLAAVELGLAHPVSGARLTLTAPLDDELAAVIAALGWRLAVPAGWLVADRVAIDEILP